MKIYRMGMEDVRDAAALAGALWDEEPEDFGEEFTQMVEEDDGAVFLAAEGGKTIGFAQASIRHDYVEGAENSPVGYLEGIYVRPEFRRQGVGKALIRACEDWARQAGLKEFASDCEADNWDSQAFHKSAGFDVANQIVCFVKTVD